jgi:hypothetical protein
MNNNTINLAGTWRFQLDPQDCGIAYRWFNHDLEQRIELPGSLQAQGYGDDVTLNTRWIGDIADRSYYTDPRYEPYRQPDYIKVPFWLQPDKHYRGAAWYQREIVVPEEWRGRRITLTLERPHWETRVWLDDHYAGANNSLSTPHVYDFGCNVAPGRHFITVRVSNEMIVDVGQNAHSVSEHTQTNWNGIVGEIALAAGSPVYVDDVQVYPDMQCKSAKVRVQLANALTQEATVYVSLSAELQNANREHHPAPITTQAHVPASGCMIEFDYPLGDEAATWDEFSPALYALTVQATGNVDGHALDDVQITTFGLREVGIIGTQLAINGRPTFIRGTLECAIFPRTGYPPTDVESWKRVIGAAKAHGLNQLRFHSWCPPEAAFIAADEMGFYYQVECAAWANQGSTIGEGRPLDRWLYEEGHRIVRAYGNHPSFIMMAYGNEPAGRHRDYLAKWVTYWRSVDPRRLHTGGAGWPIIPENDYHNIPEPRVQAWGEELRSRINSKPPETMTDYSDWVQRLGKPIVSHEIGQWCVYPNFDEIAKYTGPVKAKNFEISRDTLKANHMGDQAHDFLQASGKLQVLCYKEDIESALRTPGFAGFHLLDLHDFPGQGTALVGVLDPFWEEKGYVTPAEYSRFCNSTVLLARMSKRYWRTSETFSADLDIAHFGAAPLKGVVVEWALVNAGGMVVAQGELGPVDIPIGNGTRIGRIEAVLKGLAPARQYTLVTSIHGRHIENDWDIWVFDDDVNVQTPSDVLIVESLDDSAMAKLAQGGKVLLMLPPARVKADSTIGFSSVFWNTSWTKRAPGRPTAGQPSVGQSKPVGQSPHTLGILCNPNHAIFGEFPTESHSNWQWWELIHGSAAMTLDGLPPALRPLVQPIDTWFENRRLGLLFEARVHGGKLMVCSMDLRTDLEKRIVARQMLRSVLHYMASGAFHPQINVDADLIRAL